VDAPQGRLRPNKEELAMKLEKRAALSIVMIFVLILYPISAFAATPIRHGSDIGVDSGADSWNLFGPTKLLSVANFSYAQQVLCPNHDVAASSGDVTNAGGCSSGAYVFLFQIPTGLTNAAISFKNLVGFTFNDDPNNPDQATVGAVQCDATNTKLLCTTLGPYQIPNITFTHTSTSVTFHIPSIPAYPAGSGTQGQGLTLFVQTQQSPPVPVAFPKII
jgi:hypothetical protein